jgi:Fibronectin type III domain/FG-GAP-like repeat
MLSIIIKGVLPMVHQLTLRKRRISIAGQNIGKPRVIPFLSLGLIISLLVGLVSQAQAASLVPLAWDAANGATGYRVYYGTSSGAYTTVHDVGNNATARVTDLIVGVTYYFVVTAYNDAGESGPSNEVSFTGVPNEPVDKDFNGDGFSDLLLQNTATGQHKVLELSNGAAKSSFALPTAPLNWQMVGAGDFLGDGQVDPVLENTINGAHKIWVLLHGVLQYQLWLPTARAWHVAGAADFDGDGQADLVVENIHTGARAIWLLKGGVFSSILPLPSIGKNWHIAATGDFFGNGQADLVLENTATGARALWVLNHGVFVQSVSLGKLNLAQHIAGAADINGDGFADLILENKASGRRMVWLLQNIGYVGTIVLPNLGNGWQIVDH